MSYAANLLRRWPAVAPPPTSGLAETTSVLKVAQIAPHPSLLLYVPDAVNAAALVAFWSMT
jgi:hypothetical protein